MKFVSSWVALVDVYSCQTNMVPGPDNGWTDRQVILRDKPGTFFCIKNYAKPVAFLKKCWFSILRHAGGYVIFLRVDLIRALEGLAQ